MREYTMSTNKFNQPMYVDDYSAECLLLARLILLEPGTFQTHPNMGVGINTKWRYTDDSKLMDLELEIESQIENYLPKLSLSSVECKFGVTSENSKVIFITITTNNMKYQFTSDGVTLRLSNL